MSAELAVLNKIKNNLGMYCVDNKLFDDTIMLDISGIFPATDLSTRKIVLNLPAPKEFDASTRIKIFSSDIVAGDNYGFATANNGVTLITSSMTNNAAGTDVGAIYLSDLMGNNAIKVTPSITNTQNFGLSVGINSNKCVVGYFNNGYIFTYNLDGTNETLIQAPPGTSYFGWKVEMNETKIAVCSNTGQAYLYDLDGSNGIALNSGKAVSMTQDKVIIGDQNNGTAYIYNLDGTLLTTVTPSISVPSFGVDVDISDTHIIVGAVNTQTGNPGTAFIYNIDGTNEVILNSPLNNYDLFGNAVAIYKNQVCVSAAAEDNIHLFNIDGSYIKAINTYEDNNSAYITGQALTMDDKYIFVGDSNDEDFGPRAGALYRYSKI